MPPRSPGKQLPASVSMDLPVLDTCHHCPPVTGILRREERFRARAHGAAVTTSLLLRRNDVPLHGRATSLLSIHHPMGSWVVFTLRAIINNAAVNIHV